MSFQERFKGKTTTMTRDGVDGLVGKSSTPVQKPMMQRHFSRESITGWVFYKLGAESREGGEEAKRFQEKEVLVSKRGTRNTSTPGRKVKELNKAESSCPDPADLNEILVSNPYKSSESEISKKEIGPGIEKSHSSATNGRHGRPIPPKQVSVTQTQLVTNNNGYVPFNIVNPLIVPHYNLPLQPAAITPSVKLFCLSGIIA
jgi:hypothetical protein